APVERARPGELLAPERHPEIEVGSERRPIVLGAAEAPDRIVSRAGAAPIELGPSADSTPHPAEAAGPGTDLPQDGADQPGPAPFGTDHPEAEATSPAKDLPAADTDGEDTTGSDLAGPGSEAPGSEAGREDALARPDSPADEDSPDADQAEEPEGKVTDGSETAGPGELDQTSEDADPGPDGRVGTGTQDAEAAPPSPADAQGPAEVSGPADARSPDERSSSGERDADRTAELTGAAAAGLAAAGLTVASPGVVLSGAAAAGLAAARLSLAGRSDHDRPAASATSTDADGLAREPGRGTRDEGTRTEDDSATAPVDLPAQNDLQTDLDAHTELPAGAAPYGLSDQDAQTGSPQDLPVDQQAVPQQSDESDDLPEQGTHDESLPSGARPAQTEPTAGDHPPAGAETTPDRAEEPGPAALTGAAAAGLAAGGMGALAAEPLGGPTPEPPAEGPDAHATTPHEVGSPQLTGAAAAGLAAAGLAVPAPAPAADLPGSTPPGPGQPSALTGAAAAGTAAGLADAATRLPDPVDAVEGSPISSGEQVPTSEPPEPATSQAEAADQEPVEPAADQTPIEPAPVEPAAADQPETAQSGVTQPAPAGSYESRPRVRRRGRPAEVDDDLTVVVDHWPYVAPAAFEAAAQAESALQKRREEAESSPLGTGQAEADQPPAKPAPAPETPAVRPHRSPTGRVGRGPAQSPRVVPDVDVTHAQLGEVDLERLTSGIATSLGDRGHDNTSVPTDASLPADEPATSESAQPADPDPYGFQADQEPTERLTTQPAPEPAESGSAQTPSAAFAPGQTPAPADQPGGQGPVMPTAAEAHVGWFEKARARIADLFDEELEEPASGPEDR
ncbi:MAG: hypothetical protein Q4G45_13335, partial [Actinomycetia bacterium]|nr:hypothetical protein [Actinomycetes bacterium]